MSRDDYAIITGDFGGVWDDSPGEAYWLDWLEKKPFTTLFVDGNHENFNRLNELPVHQWQGGTVHCIRPHVLHLMRGQVFEIDGMSFFTMGGAASHDIQDGILDPASPDFEREYWFKRRMLQSQAKADYLVSTANLHMETCDGIPTLRLLDESGTDRVEPLDILPTAHRQMGTYLNIPWKYYERMCQENIGLLAQNVNT